MYDYEIKKLSSKFYINYDKVSYPELLSKDNRSYDVAIFELEFLKDIFVCLPFRSNIQHNNGYRFKFSARSKKSNSGVDFSKIVLIKNADYIGQAAKIDNDEFIEFKKFSNSIHSKLSKYILDYCNHIKGISILHEKEFDRKYKYSTLSYFHELLDL